MSNIEQDIYNIPPSYKKLLKEELSSHLFDELFSTTIKQYQKEIIYPPSNKIYSALKLTPASDVKVIIIGQDPYIHEGQANGLAFSVDCNKLPPSLINIYKELNYEYGYEISSSGDLSSIAKQGVLFLNSILTVKDGISLSNKNIGWEKFTSSIIYRLNELNKDIIFLIWGNNAYNLIKNLSLKYIVRTSHPSPLSFYHGFYKSNCFKKVNDILISINQRPIVWKIDK